MLKNILSSGARVEVLKLLLFNPQNSYYQRQIARLTDQPIRAIQRELKNLEEVGLVEKQNDGNRIYYTINKRCPIFEDLKNIFFKVEGIGKLLKEYLKDKSDTIEFAFIYGSYARGEERISSDIDLMVIGNISAKELSTVLSAARKEINREINYMILHSDEFRNKARNKEHFVNSVINDEKIFLIGDINEFEKLS